MSAFDDLSLKILRSLQEDTTLPLEALAGKLGASKTSVWNRIRKLRRDGTIKREVALLDPEAVGLDCCFYVLIRTAHHEAGWMDNFLDTMKQQPEIVEAHRLAGAVDYILKVRVSGPKHYDRFYQRLVSNIDIHDVTSLLSMETLIETTRLPL